MEMRKKKTKTKVHILYWRDLIITTTGPEDLSVKTLWGNGRVKQIGEMRRVVYFHLPCEGSYMKFSVSMPNNPDKITLLFN